MTARRASSVLVSTTPAHGIAARPPIPGHRALHIIRSAIAQRTHLVGIQVGQLTHADIIRPVRELEDWCSKNPHASHATLAAFWAGTLGLHLRTIMPSTRGGAALLAEFERLSHEPHGQL